MRKYHRWLAVIFGVFLFWIALTGFGIQLVTLTQGEGDEHHEAEEAPDAQAGKFALIPQAKAHGDEEHEAATPANPQAAGAPADFACPKDWTCRPAPSAEEHEAREALEFVMELHSGEAFGPVGVWLSIASSIALAFFALSGVWMYVQMWRARKGKGGLFWG